MITPETLQDLAEHDHEVLLALVAGGTLSTAPTHDLARQLLGHYDTGPSLLAIATRLVGERCDAARAVAVLRPLADSPDAAVSAAALAGLGAREDDALRAALEDVGFAGVDDERAGLARRVLYGTYDTPPHAAWTRYVWRAWSPPHADPVAQLLREHYPSRGAVATQGGAVSGEAAWHLSVRGDHLLRLVARAGVPRGLVALVACACVRLALEACPTQRDKLHARLGDVEAWAATGEGLDRLCFAAATARVDGWVADDVGPVARLAQALLCLNRGHAVDFADGLESTALAAASLADGRDVDAGLAVFARAVRRLVPYDLVAACAARTLAAEGV